MPPFPKNPIKRRKLYEDLVEQLEDMMLTGVLKPGDPLPSERDLMEIFEVGRTSVREALFALQKMGLITVRNGERAFVTRPSSKKLISAVSGTVKHMLNLPEGLREFQGARILLESALARNAAIQRTDEELDNIAQALEENRLTIGKLKDFTLTDVKFHFSIIKVSKNAIFEELHSAMYTWLSGQRETGLQIAGADEHAYSNHKQIYDAIAAEDPDAAEQAMREHLTTVNQNYWSAISDPTN